MTLSANSLFYNAKIRVTRQALANGKVTLCVGLGMLQIYKSKTYINRTYVFNLLLNNYIISLDNVN